MKYFMAHILFQLYLWGMILIPALHHAGIIFPHSHCSHGNKVVAYEDTFGKNRSSSFLDDDECQICNFASTLLETPQKFGVSLISLGKSPKIIFASSNVQTSAWNLRFSRAPPEIF
jgi:hypothetical protein